MFDPFIEACALRDPVARRELRAREVARNVSAPHRSVEPEARRVRDRDGGARPHVSRGGDPPYPARYRSSVSRSRSRTYVDEGNPHHVRLAELRELVPPADAEIVVRLRRAGGVLLGKTATPEYGGRPTTEGGLCPPARNPWNLEHTTGGSSGGAAAQVATGLGPLAEGSDGGGSVRIPASCCGVVGLKPSRGRVTLSPVAGEIWGGLFTNGPITRSVRDAALMLDVMAGHVDGDPYRAAPLARPLVESVSGPRKPLRLGTLAKSALGSIDAETVAAFSAACRVFADMGHRLEPRRRPRGPTGRALRRRRRRQPGRRAVRRRRADRSDRARVRRRRSQDERGRVRQHHGADAQRRARGRAVADAV